MISLSVLLVFFFCKHNTRLLLSFPLAVNSVGFTPDAFARNDVFGTRILFFIFRRNGGTLSFPFASVELQRELVTFFKEQQEERHLSFLVYLFTFLPKFGSLVSSVSNSDFKG